MLRCYVCSGGLCIGDFCRRSCLCRASDLLHHGRRISGGKAGGYHHATIFAVVCSHALIGRQGPIDDADEVSCARHAELHHRYDLNPLSLPETRGCCPPVGTAQPARAEFDASEEARHDHAYPIKPRVLNSLQYGPPCCSAWLSIVAEAVVGANFPCPTVVTGCVIAHGSQKVVELVRGSEGGGEGYETAFLYDFLFSMLALQRVYVLSRITTLGGIAHDAFPITTSFSPPTPTHPQPRALVWVTPLSMEPMERSAKMR
mmetsp:Transcript_7560/g.14029  ORF Transcript_7560/g.14029 Transcript_7560/m.14029 type:complete len:259 (-) Transcript_7560:128-904(-)